MCVFLFIVFGALVATKLIKHPTSGQHHPTCQNQKEDDDILADLTMVLLIIIALCERNTVKIIFRGKYAIKYQL